jgi:hypothetical protein
MNDRAGLGLRILGVLVGIGAIVPIGSLAILFVQACPTCRASVALGGITVALIIATVAIADGQAWGALAIAFYGAGMAALYAVATYGLAYATTSDAAFAALHLAIAVLALVVALGLTRERPTSRPRDTDADGRGSGDRGRIGVRESG